MEDDIDGEVSSGVTTAHDKRGEGGDYEGNDHDVSTVTEDTITRGFAPENDDQANATSRLRAGLGKRKTVNDMKSLIQQQADVSERAIRDVSNQYCNDRKSELALSKVLWKQIRSLSEMEKEAKERIEQQKLEHLVEKVEGEIEYEGVLDEMCMRVRAEEEAMEMERREREWELERREVRLEEEVMLLKGKVRRLEEDLRVAHVEKNYMVQRKQNEMDEAIQRLLYELQDGEKFRLMCKDVPIEHQQKDVDVLAGSSEHEKSYESSNQEILIAFEDMLKEADERHEREKQALEDTIRAKEEAEDDFRHERQKWHAREKQMESQMLALEKEIGRLSSLLREKDSSVLSEKERRKASQEEADKLSAMLKDERSAHKMAVAKLKKLESSILKLKEKVGREQAEVGKDVNCLKDLEKDLGRLSAILSQKKDLPRSVEAEQLQALKKQLDIAVTERDKLEEKLNLLLKRSRDREAEIDAMWLERERILIDKMNALEEQAEQWEIKCRRCEAENLHERKMYEQGTCTLRRDWEDEKCAWEGMIRERETWLKEQDERMTCLLEAKDCELHTLKNMQQKLLDALALNKKQVEEMKKQIRQQGANEGSNISTDELSKEIPEVQEVRKPEESEAKSCVDIESMASEMEAELQRLSKELRSKEENLEKERSEVKLGTDRLRLERRELERKVSETLALMEELKSEMQGKEVQMEWERKQMETAVVSKTTEVETLRKQLESKELEMEVRVEKFRSEMELIEQEIEKERRERQKVMDLHFASKKKMAGEAQLKEETWEKDMERMVQELTNLRAKLRDKNEELESINRDKTVQESQFTEEKKAWVASQKEQECEVSRIKQENAELFQQLHKAAGKEISGRGLTADPDFIWPVSNVNQSTEDKRNAEWQIALGKVAVFDKQITEAMHAIQNLREELTAKEAELLKARTEPEAEWERREEQWAQEQERQEAIYMQRAAAWQKREQDLLTEKGELVKLLESERSEAADAVALLQGAVRELHWSLMRKSGMDVNGATSKQNVEDVLKCSKKGDMVKVHASHLKEVDQYICDLKSRVEELDNKLTIAGAIETKKTPREEELDEALLHVEKEIFRLSPDRRSRLTLAEDKLGSPPVPTRTRSLEKNLLSGITTLKSQPGPSDDRLWNLDGPLSCVHKVAVEDRLVSQVLPAQDLLALALPARHQKKWVVDASWIEHVRKEHSILTQQLILERQRVAALGQVEAENRWMEAMMLRALEQKKECELKLAQLQQKMMKRAPKTSWKTALIDLLNAQRA